MSSVKDCCGFGSKFEFRVGEDVWVEFGVKLRSTVVCGIREDAWRFGAVIFGDGIFGTCAGNDLGWVMGDTSEFGIVGGCASARARGAELAGLCDFSDQSDARWSRSSWATMPNQLRMVSKPKNLRCLIHKNSLNGLLTASSQSLCVLIKVFPAVLLPTELLSWKSQWWSKKERLNYAQAHFNISFFV